MIQRLTLHEEIANSVVELQNASYKVEAELLGFHDLPPLKDTVTSLRQSEETFYGYYLDDVLVGVISFVVTERVLDIHRLAVHPMFFRQGIAARLLTYVETLEGDMDRITVCTGSANLPATTLYQKHGYQKIRDRKVSQGLHLTEFEKHLLR